MARSEYSANQYLANATRTAPLWTAPSRTQRPAKRKGLLARIVAALF